MQLQPNSFWMGKCKRLATAFSLVVTLTSSQIPIVQAADATSTAYTNPTAAVASDDAERDNTADFVPVDGDGRLGHRTSTGAFPGSQEQDASSELSIIQKKLAATERPKTLKTYRVDTTAYTSSVEECDDSPWITADGSRTRDGIIAANFLPFGTKVRIPSVFGDKIFEVHDRMNARYWYRVDVWMLRKQDMRQYGIKRNIEIEVVEWGDNSTQWMTWKKAQLAAKTK